MTDVQRQVRVAQARLWANRWFAQTCWMLTGAAGALAAVVLFDRLYALEWPLGWIALILVGVAAVAATAWSYALRADAEVAAATLDQAAGLRERISTGLYCQQDAGQQDDPFARAVVTDAERISRSLSVRQHIRLRAPFAAVYAAAAMVLAALLLLLPSGLLLGEEVEQQARQSEEVKRTKVVVQRRLEEVKKLAQANPALKDLKEDLEKLDLTAPDRLQNPEQVRHEAIKKIDRLSDALREQRQDSRFDKTEQIKKMLRSIKPPGEARTTAQKLAQSLAKGDFKAANEQIKAMQEQLAKMQSPQDAAKLQQMQKQLAELAKKISAAADDKQLTQKLLQAGLKKEDLERMLRNLSKKDLDQLRKQLQKQGLSQKEIDKLAQQLQKRQQAGLMANQMSQALKQAADAAGQGQMGQAMAGLESAGDQLSELEMLEQEMNQIDSTMADLQDAKNDLDNPCSSCNGTGMQGGKPCGGCQGQGGMGPRPGRGRGGLAPEEQTATAFKIHRDKVKTTKGRIIGQFLVDGQQVKGQVSEELAETIAAEESQATDLIHRDRIPRIYQPSVKKYFSSMRHKLARAKTSAGSEESADSATDETVPGDATDPQPASGDQVDNQ